MDKKTLLINQDVLKQWKEICEKRQWCGFMLLCANSEGQLKVLMLDVPLPSVIKQLRIIADEFEKNNDLGTEVFSMFG